MDEDLAAALSGVVAGEYLSEDRSAGVVETMMSGEACEIQVAGLLTALATRGETIAEITGATRALRSQMIGVQAPKDALDVVGTGGDNAATFNLSTTAAVVVAGAGVPVAKHGNRSVSSRCGAADVLESLGVRLNVAPKAVERCIQAAKIGFMMAPNHHPAMRHVAGVRRVLKIRTLFNLVGPLSNPARVTRMLLGVNSPTLLEPFADVLVRLGVGRAWVVHGDGLDELTTCGRSEVIQIADGQQIRMTIDPEDVGLSRADPVDLRGGDAKENAAALRSVLEGKPGPFPDATYLNAGACMVIAQRAEDLREGMELAKRSIASGAAMAALEALIRESNRSEP